MNRFVLLPRRVAWSAPVVALVCGAVGLLAQVPPVPHAAPEPASSAVAGPEPLLREGSALLDELGEFHNTGERILFQPRARQTPLQVLENLALERVMRALQEGSSERPWSVSGTVTEYRGANFLLISRAVLTSSAPSDTARPAPAG